VGEWSKVVSHARLESNMPGRKYPLEPLVKLRQREVDGATEKLAHAIAERESAERKRLVAEKERERADEVASLVRNDERSALEKGTLRAGDLQRAQAWEIGVGEQRKRLIQQVSTASQDEERAHALEDTARTELATREADAEVVDKDKTRFDAKSAQLDLAREEEAAAEVRANVKPRDDQ
jgi:hypothetical protein